MAKKLFPGLLMSLLLTLYGCEPNTPAKQVPEPATAVSAPIAASAVSPVAQAPVPPVVKPQPTASSSVAERELAQKSGCFTCHTIEKKLVGPAWNDVAAKYRGQKDAEARLIAKVAKGGSGVWGAVPMPPNSPRVSEGDIKILVHFILTLN